MNYARKRDPESGHTIVNLPVPQEPEKVPSNILKRPLKLPPMKRIK